MDSDCPVTYAPTLQLPRPISGLNLWPPEEESPSSQREVISASNRGIRRGNFVINPQWTSENTVDVPRAMGDVYEPAPQDFFGARALHAKTWEQAAIYPGHGTNSHLASPGYTPYRYVPVGYRTAREEIANAWPWNQSATGAVPGADTHADLKGDYDRYLQTTPVAGGRSPRGAPPPRPATADAASGGSRGGGRLSDYAEDPYLKLPHPLSTGCTRELTDQFALTHERHRPQMDFREAHHVAPFHAYMTSYDWGESDPTAEGLGQ